MTATPNGWLNEPGRLAQLRAVAALVYWAPYHEYEDQRFKWAVDLTFYGDCTIKTASAENLLAAWGWPEDAMERWTCDLPDGKRHAVLIINIADADGTVIPTAIDCRHQVPMRMDDLGYSDWAFVS